MHACTLANVGFCDFRGVRARQLAQAFTVQAPCHNKHIAATTTPTGTSGALGHVRSPSDRFALCVRTWQSAKMRTKIAQNFDQEWYMYVNYCAPV